MRRPGGSLFVRKLQAEAIVLAAPPGWSLHREPLTGVTKFAASSALLSAARSLLETFDTSAMRGEYVPAQAGDAAAQGGAPCRPGQALAFRAVRLRP